ncbi:hypothetical protein ONS96_004956 [Cadophora gregata f. sp. sojae]|nr:hypothetical protein ONS96_004956 [Cadophora gregata f. sp. sojae]
MASLMQPNFSKRLAMMESSYMARTDICWRSSYHNLPTSEPTSMAALSTTDYASSLRPLTPFDKGFSPDEAKELCQALEKAEFDFIELSGGTYESLAFEHKRESTVKRESFFIEFAEEIVKPLTKTKTYVTGGLKTVGAMVKALDTVDGVGIARPACQEPHLPKDMLEGRVTGAIKMKLDDNNFGLTNVAAGTQIRQVGKDQEPIDLSVQENVNGFMRDMEAWGKKMGSDKEMNEYGYVDLSGPAKPYVST